MEKIDKLIDQFKSMKTSSEILENFEKKQIDFRETLDKLNFIVCENEARSKKRIGKIEESIDELFQRIEDPFGTKKK